MRGCLLRGEFESANPALAALKDRPRDQSGKDRILLANPQVPKFVYPHAFLEGQKTGKTSPRKSTPRTLK